MEASIIKKGVRVKGERGRGEDCIKRAFAVENRDRGSNVIKSSLAVLIYRVVSVILMRKVRLLGRGRGKLRTSRHVQIKTSCNSII